MGQQQLVWHVLSLFGARRLAVYDMLLQCCVHLQLASIGSKFVVETSSRINCC